MLKYVWLAVVAVEVALYLARPRVLAALGWLPLFRARRLVPSASWGALLRSVDARGAAYRAPARMDLGPLAALESRSLSSSGAAARMSADGRLAVVHGYRFMPFLSIIPFCQVARITLDESGSAIVVRVFGYPLFTASVVFGTFAAIWTAPTPDTAPVVAICGCVWLAMEVFATRSRIRDVVLNLESLVESPRS